MIWVFVAVGALLVTAISLLAVGGAVRRTEGQLVPTVLEVPDAVDWIAERLPEEAAAGLTLDDVSMVLAWWLEYVDAQGLVSEYGQDLGGADATGTPIDESAAVDHVVARALDVPEEQGGALDPVAVVVVLDLFGIYLREMGAIGGPVEDRG
ncbi:MAG: hypothetical protein QF532_06730 [Acidimicrobiales bacterium]|jgi:hypothetical protein|nr:hypothetical protein [Acidimicrobiales bacterium]